MSWLLGASNLGEHQVLMLGFPITPPFTAGHPVVAERSSSPRWSLASGSQAPPFGGACKCWLSRATIPPSMPLQVFQRPHWHGRPIELGDLFRLHKNRREARAALLTHQLGWEVRLLVGSQLEVAQTQVSRDQEAVLATGERWKQG